MNAPKEDMSWFHEVRRDSLLNISYSDGIAFEVQGEKHTVIPEAYKPYIQFWKNDVLLGHEAVTYKGRVVYDRGNGGVKKNQTTAVLIVQGIEHGYQYNPEFYKD